MTVRHRPVRNCMPRERTDPRPDRFDDVEAVPRPTTVPEMRKRSPYVDRLCVEIARRRQEGTLDA